MVPIHLLGTLIGVAGMLVLVTGCPGKTPPPGPRPCEADSDCGNGAFCDGVETCADGACAAGTAPCVAPEVCNEAMDRCEACDNEGQAACDDGDACTDDACVAGACAFSDVACEDDGEFCDGTESCDRATGDCLSSGDPCGADAGEACNEEEDRCDACGLEGQAPCDDGSLCTNDACVDGRCVSSNVVCVDDGLFCTGAEVCDPATGECISEGDPCDMPEEFCLEGVDVCVVDGHCIDHADCDDGMFCNGVETCRADGLCIAGSGPCDDGLFCNGVETCDEDNDVCVDGADPCDTIMESCDEEEDMCVGFWWGFTSGIDFLTGTDATDVFRTTDEWTNTGDFLDSRGGIDRFDWITAGEENDVIDVINTENIYFRNVFPGQEIDLDGFEGVEQHWFDCGIADLLLYNVHAIAAVGYTGGNGVGDFEVVFDASVVADDEDAMEILLYRADGDDLIIDGFEVFNVNVTGDSVLDSLESTDLQVVNIFGEGSVTISDLDGTHLELLTVNAGSSLTIATALESTEVHTVDASAATGDVWVSIANSTVDAVMNGGGGDDTLSGGSGEDDITGGPGDDTLSGGIGSDIIEGGDDDDTINGGDGIDELDGGAGANTFQFDVANVDATDADIITGFTAGVGGDVFAIDVSAAGGGVVAALVDGVVVAIAASADNSFIVDAAGIGYANFAAAEAAVQAVNAATVDYALLFFNTTTSRIELYIDANSSAAGAGVVLAALADIDNDAAADDFLADFDNANYDAF